MTPDPRALGSLLVLALAAGCGPDAHDPDSGAPMDAARPDAVIDGVDAGPADGSAEDPDGGAPDGGGPFVPLGEALDCRRPGTAGLLAPGTGLFRVDVDPARYPDALCNDGTGAVFYVRRASRPEDANRWMIFLQGGGTCRNAQDCANRWCSHDTYFGSTKMSSRDAPPHGAVSPGIQRPSADNPFGSWNQVLVYYCSSDSWAGTRRDAELVADHPLRDGEEVRFRMHFLGSRIFDAVIDMLRGEAGAVAYTEAGGAGRELPDLDDAELVLLAGSSAGSGGVRNQLDGLAELLRERNGACAGGGACPLEVRGVLDAALVPDRERLDLSESVPCTSAGLCTFEQMMRFEWEHTVRGMYGARGDQSCERWHAGDGSEWHCADLGHVMRHHLTTPFFLRQDQSDSLLRDNTVETGYRVPRRDGALLDARLFSELVAEEMAALSLPSMREVAHEGPSIDVLPGTYSPRCGHHEALPVNAPTFDVTIHVDGDDLSTIDVLSSWLRDESPISAVATAPGTFHCP